MTPRPPARTKYERAIYYRHTASGERRWEYTYIDSDGRQRWKSTFDNGAPITKLADARALRAEKIAGLARGERIAPTKLTLAEVADLWLEAQTNLRPRTLDNYRTVLRLHVLPRLGRRQIAKVDTQDVADLIAGMHRDGFAGWTIRGVLTPLGRIFGFAIRRGMIATNPISSLEAGERTKVERRELRILDRDEIGRLLDAAPENHRTVIAVAVMTGLRQGELLGLVWGDIDFDAGVIRVRRQLDRKTQTRVVPKTPQAVRDVVLIPALAAMLRAHRLASRYSLDTDYVFSTASGRPVNYRNVTQRGLDKALERIGVGEYVQVNGCMRWRSALRWHDLRHTYASILISQGQSVVYVSRQLGHANPNITLSVYAHLFDSVEHAHKARNAMEAEFGSVLGG